MPIRVDPDNLASLASQCSSDMADLSQSVANLQAHMALLQSALDGFPNLAMIDRFKEWSALVSQLHQAIEENQAYVSSVTATLREFVAGLGRA